MLHDYIKIKPHQVTQNHLFEKARIASVMLWQIQNTCKIPYNTLESKRGTKKYSKITLPLKGNVYGQYKIKSGK